MMRRRLAHVVTAALVAGSAIVLAQGGSGRVQLEAARKAEVVDGDLKGAIRQYESIATRYTSDRALVAEALLRMAECYQKLGDSESKRIYERLVREFGDQPPAAAARARLGPEPRGAVRTGDRAVWSGGEVDLFGTISPDGRSLSYTDWFTTNNTLVRDLVKGTNRAITSNERSFGDHGFSGWSAISRDGRQIAFEWKPAGSNADELRLANLSGSGVPASRVIRQFADGEGVRPFDWSPDNRSIAVMIERVDRASTIGILSVGDGSFRQLKSIDWRGVSKMVFSPDGRFFAYDLATSDDGRQSQILVMASDGDTEQVIVDDRAENHVMGWARDGQLVYASRKTGALSLWSAPVADGRAAGTPRLARENLASSWSLGMTTAGTLYIWKRASTPYVKAAFIDLATGRIGEDDSLSFQRFIESRGRPTWSRDGTQLAYISCSASGGGPCALFVRSTETGAVREIPHQLRYLGFPKFSPDGRQMLTEGRDTKGRGRIFVIDLDTGVTRRVLADSELEPHNPEWSGDGQSIRYTEARGTERAVVERSLATGAVTELFRIPAGAIGAVQLSPDQRYFGYVVNDPAARSSMFIVRPRAGGEARALLTGGRGSIGFHWNWRPDSSGVLLERMKPDGMADALWHVPLSGEPRRLQTDLSQWQDSGVFDLHPDGRHIAFAAFSGNAGAEVWAIENFLPKPGTASR